MTHLPPVLRLAPDPRAVELRRTGNGSGKLIFLLVVSAWLAAAGGLQADQVFKACGKKWARKAAKLAPEQLTWMLDQRAAELAGDLDGDGREDTVLMSNTGSFRDCDVEHHWDHRETTVTIRYGNGKSQIVHWIGPQRVESLRVYHGVGRILVIGVDAAGEPFNKWVEYREGRPAEAGVLLADAPTAPAAVAAKR